MPFIYQIRNTVNQKRYVGKSKNPTKRFQTHLRVSKNTDKRSPLYDSIRKYGVDSFSLLILEECDSNLENQREKFWISTTKPELNLTVGGDGGDTFSARSTRSQNVTRRKLSKRNLELLNDPIHRAKISSGVRRAYSSDPTIKEKISIAVRLRHLDPKYAKWHSSQVKKAIQKRGDLWGVVKRGKRNSRWLGYINFIDPVGNLVKQFETSKDCSKETGIGAHHIRTLARECTTMQRGKYRGYSFVFTLNEINLTIT